jgi:hypothetical protein
MTVVVRIQIQNYKTVLGAMQDERLVIVIRSSKRNAKYTSVFEGLSAG